MPYAYRGENAPSAGKPGRTPAEVVEAGGFRPWLADSVAQARSNLLKLIDLGTLKKEAEAWCLGKDRQNGWFFSTGLDEHTAYNNYDYFYRIDIDGLVQVDWYTIGAAPVAGMSLYLNGDTLDHSTLIAVVWSVRKAELLVMSPVAVDAIDILDGDKWVALKSY
jgi:hypothetical protein